jgi:hypothetical protein
MAKFSQYGVGVLKASLQWDVARFAIIATWMNAGPTLGFASFLNEVSNTAEGVADLSSRM